MDNIVNYQNALSQFQSAKQVATDRASAELAEKKEKLRDLTNPFEQLGIDDASDLFKKGVSSVGKKLLSKVGLNEKNAKKLVDAHNAGGVKGVLDQLRKDRPQLGSRKVSAIGPREPLKLSGDIDPSANLEDLLPKEFGAIKGTANRAIKAELGNLEPVDRLNFVSKFNELKSTATFGGDDNLKQQFNLQQAKKALDFAKEGGEEADSALSIASMKPQDFRQLQPVLKGSIEAEKGELHPAYRQAFDGLMNDRVATKEDIPDDFLRSKFNLHQEARSLDDIKNLTPSSLAPLPEIKATGAIEDIYNKANTQVSKLTGNVASRFSQVQSKLTTKADKEFQQGVDDALGQARKGVSTISQIGGQVGGVAGAVLGRVGEIQQVAQGKGSLKSFEKVGKQEGISQAQDLGEDVAKKVARKALGQAAEKGAEKGGEEFAETEALGGGPEDPIGDVIGAVVGLGTFLGGLFGARHLHSENNQPNVNVAYQMGA